MLSSKKRPQRILRLRSCSHCFLKQKQYYVCLDQFVYQVSFEVTPPLRSGVIVTSCTGPTWCHHLIKFEIPLILKQHDSKTNQPYCVHNYSYTWYTYNMVYTLLYNPVWFNNNNIIITVPGGRIILIIFIMFRSGDKLSMNLLNSLALPVKFNTDEWCFAVGR